MPDSWKKIAENRQVQLLILVMATVLSYANAVPNGYIWDDDHYVTNNETLRSVGGLKEIWTNPKATPQYYPLVHTSFWLEYRLWNLRPMGYHVTNILLHAAVAVLLWLVLLRLKISGAWFAAVLFAVHPVHVESVAWITERKNVLSGVFYMVALLSFLRAVEWSKDELRMPDWRWHLASLAFFVCALLSKTVTCSLPAVIVLLIWWRQKRLGRFEWRLILTLVPFFFVGLLLALNTARMEQEQVGAQGAEWSYGMVERCLIAGRALWFYLGKLLIPHPLMFFYRRWTIAAARWWQYLFPGLFGALLLALFLLRKRLGRGPLVAMLIFAGTLVPALGFFNVYPHRYSFVADHFQYLASISVIVLAVAWLTTRLPAWKPLAAAVVALVFGVLTFLQCGMYRDAETLWRTTIARNPESWAARNNLGLLLMRCEQYEEAEIRFLEVLQLKPDHAAAMANLGMVYARTKQLGKARAVLQRAIRLKPGDARIRLLAADAYAISGLHDAALTEYRFLLQHNPDLVGAYLGAGNVFMEKQDFARAAAFYREALKRRPNDPLLLRSLKRAEEALAE